MRVVETVRLSGLDLAVVAIFLAAILALGFSARLRELSILQFLAAGRALTLPAFVATLVSTWYGGILGIGESVSFFGLGTWLLLGVPYYVFALVYAFVFAERVRDADQLSIPERFHLMWGRKAGLAGASLIFLLGVPAAHVLMLGVMVQAISGWDLVPSVLLATVIGTLFLAKGGLLADVRVGMLAFAMMYIGFGAMVLYCLATDPLPAMLARIEDRTLVTFTGGQGPIAVLSFFILGAWTLVDPGFHQRVASAATPKVGKRGVLVSVGCWFLFDVLSITTAMYALSHAAGLPEDKLQIFPAFAQRVLPDGLKAVFLCGILGTVLSAMVGYTLVSGTTLGRELVGRLRPEFDDRRLTVLSRVGLFVAAGTAIAIALSLPSVVALWYQWGGVLIGALILPVCLAYLPAGRRMGAPWVVAALVAAFATSLGWLVYGKRTGNGDLMVVWLGESFSLGTLMPGLAVSAAILAVGAAASRRMSDDRR